jgi:hypothetical protein
MALKLFSDTEVEILKNMHIPTRVSHRTDGG